MPDRITANDIIEALRSALVDISAYEAGQAGEDFDPGSIEISEEEIARIYRIRGR